MEARIPGGVAPPRAVLYLRQSVAREESISLELQEAACREHCARHGYQVVAVESDPGISGRTWNRPAVQRVMGMLERGDAGVVVLWKWSRLSRSRLDWAVAVDKVERLGAAIESATEPVDVSTASGRFARGMLAEVAAFESERIGEQWRETHARRRAQGLPAAGGARFGYELVGGAYRPDPVTGPVLASMFRQYVDGAGFTAIARSLNRAGVPTLGGGPWSRDRVTKVLDSGFGAGLIVHHARSARRTYATGAHQPVVDDALWARYQRERERRAGEPPRASEPLYPLSGLLRCGDCGAAMHATPLGRERGYGFICGRWHATGEGLCVTVSRAKAERAVLDWLATVAGDVEAAAAVEASRRAARAEARADARVLARRVTQLEGGLSRLARGWADGLVPDAGYAQARDGMLADLEAARVALAAAGREGDQAAGRARPVVRGLLAEWDTLPVRERRDMLRVLLDGVVVERGVRRGDVSVRVVPRGP
jgi:DNA invertase Pin-like site-specific DNA recombinase